jgi:hypothetical protein
MNARYVRTWPRRSWTRSRSIKQLVANVRSGIQHISAATPQLVNSQRWTSMVRYIVARILEAQPKFTPMPPALPSG